MSQKQIYDTVMKWMNERLKENNNPDSRVVFSDEAQGTIAGVGEEWITFYSSALSLDRTWVNYQITVTCKLGSCLVELEKIRFTYRETEKYKAEEWITDEYALNKAKTKLVRGLAKWRRKTVDFADDIFMDVAVAFGAPDTRPKSEKKKKEEVSVAASIANSSAQDKRNTKQGSHYDHPEPAGEEDFSIHSVEEARRAIIWGEILQRKY